MRPFKTLNRPVSETTIDRICLFSWIWDESVKKKKEEERKEKERLAFLLMGVKKCQVFIF